MIHTKFVPNRRMYYTAISGVLIMLATPFIHDHTPAHWLLMVISMVGVALIAVAMTMQRGYYIE